MTTPAFENGALALAAGAALCALCAAAALAWGRMRGAKPLFWISLVIGLGLGFSSFVHRPEEFLWIRDLEPFHLQSLTIALVRETPYQVLLLLCLSGIMGRAPAKKRHGDVIAAALGLAIGLGFMEALSHITLSGEWPLGVAYRAFFEPLVQVATAISLGAAYALRRGERGTALVIGALLGAIALNVSLGAATYELAWVGHWLALLFPHRLMATALIAASLVTLSGVVAIVTLAWNGAHPIHDDPSGVDRLLLSPKPWTMVGLFLALTAGGAMLACLSEIRGPDVHAALIALLLTPPLLLASVCLALAASLRKHHTLDLAKAQRSRK